MFHCHCKLHWRNDCALTYIKEFPVVFGRIVMKHRYKPLNRQTMVITGASSGIGLATAKRAARSGTRLVLVARNEEGLKQVCDEIKSYGGHAIYVVADIGDADQVQNIVTAAVDEFGGFDT